jgi:hypothetical protein
MDTGDGTFRKFAADSDGEFKKKVDDLHKLYPGHGGIFREGEEVELKGSLVEGEEVSLKTSRFVISKILQDGLKLKLLPRE